MKKIILFFLLFSKVVFAQESNDKIIYLDSLFKEVSIEYKYYTKIIKDYYIEKSEYKFLMLYKNDKIKEEKTLSGKDGGFIIGEELSYYENGNKKSSTLYENKMQHGKTIEWYENKKIKEEGEFNSANLSTGKHFKMINYWNEKGEKTVTNGNGLVVLKNDYYQETGNYKNGYRDGKWNGKSLKTTFSYEEIYSDGELVSGISTNEDGTKNEYTQLEVKPEPKKGFQDFYKYIGNNFIQSDLSWKNNIYGKIIVEFVVEKDGSISEIVINKGLGYGLDEEAIRVVKKYNNWNPGLQKGRKVRCKFKIPITIQPPE
jgi:TonB family protein